MEFGSLGHRTWQLSSIAHLLCIKIRNSNTFNLSACGRVGISESNPEQKKYIHGGPGNVGKAMS